MPKSRKNPERKDKLNNYKKQNKREKIMENLQNLNNQLPQTREVPRWDANEKIEVTGKEFELLYNFVTSIGDAYAAAQSIMSRNILNGKIQVDFEKLVDNGDGTFQYVEMTDEEQAPKKEEYNKLINSILSKQAEMPEEFTPVDENGLPVINP